MKVQKNLVTALAWLGITVVETCVNKYIEQPRYST